MDQWTGGPVDRWTGGPVDRWTGGPVDRWTSTVQYCSVYTAQYNIIVSDIVTEKIKIRAPRSARILFRPEAQGFTYGRAKLYFFESLGNLLQYCIKTLLYKKSKETTQQKQHNRNKTTETKQKKQNKRNKTTEKKQKKQSKTTETKETKEKKKSINSEILWSK